MLTCHNSGISMSRHICLSLDPPILVSFLVRGKNGKISLVTEILILYEKYSECRKLVLCHY